MAATKKAAASVTKPPAEDAMISQTAGGEGEGETGDLPPSTHVTDPVPDAPQLTNTPLAPEPKVRVRVTRNGNAEAGGGHYTLRVGAIMVVGQRVADDLIAQRMAEEV